MVADPGWVTQLEAGSGLYFSPGSDQVVISATRVPTSVQGAVVPVQEEGNTRRRWRNRKAGAGERRGHRGGARRHGAVR